MGLTWENPKVLVTLYLLRKKRSLLHSTLHRLATSNIFVCFPNKHSIMQNSFFLGHSTNADVLSCMNFLRVTEAWQRGG